MLLTQKNFSQEMSDTKRKHHKRLPETFLHSPDCPDEKMRAQIKTGKDPHIGAERSLYSLQQQFLDMAGPLTCMHVGRYG